MQPIGIDFGTTNTLVAVLEDGRPRVVPNAEGQPLTPSVVAFDGSGAPLVGSPAVEAADAVFSVKRVMGSPRRIATPAGEYAPQEIAAMVLRKVLRDAGERLGEPVRQAVVTVPAYFNDVQRQATMEAGRMAGLEVVRLLNEPTAAALAYGMDRTDSHTLLVWDLGGGTFDVSLLELDGGILEVRAVSGDNWLGGDDFDERLAGFLEGERRRLAGAPPPEDGSAWPRLRAASRSTREALSTLSLVRVPVPGPGAPLAGAVEVEVTRARLEGLVADLLERLAVPCRQVLADAGIGPEGVDAVLLVGGATRMPAVRRLARGIMGREPYRLINPEEVVALGAAVQAGALWGRVERVVLLDVLPLSLGIETQGGLMSTIVHRNAPLPAAGSRIVTTAKDAQTSMEVHVLQGERAMATDNVSLGQFEFSGISSAPRGVAKVEVALTVDTDGVVHVAATDLRAEEGSSIRLASSRHHDALEVEGLVAEARARAAEDEGLRRGVLARNQAADLLESAGRAVANPGAAEGGQRRRLLRAIALMEGAMGRCDPDRLARASARLREAMAAGPPRPGGAATAAPPPAGVGAEKTRMTT